MFTRLSSIYGHVWSSSFKTEHSMQFAKKEWAEGLRQFNNLILRDALLNLRESRQLPPTLPQFIELCKAIGKRYESCGPKNKMNKPDITDFGRRQIQLLKNRLAR